MHLARANGLDRPPEILGLVGGGVQGQGQKAGDEGGEPDPHRGKAVIQGHELHQKRGPPEEVNVTGSQKVRGVQGAAAVEAKSGEQEPKHRPQGHGEPGELHREPEPLRKAGKPFPGEKEVHRSPP